jgi:hypothetical protein
MDDHDMDPRLERTIRYVEGDLSSAERMEFERELQQDVQLREELEAVRTTLGALRQLGEDRLREQLRGVDVASIGKGSKGGRRVWWAAAAVLLLVAGWWGWSGIHADERLAEEFAFQEPGLPVLMGPAQLRMDAIMNAYKQDDMTVAARLIHDALVASPGNDTLLYFQAVVTERGGDRRSAAEQFKAVPIHSVFADRAVYKIAVIQLHNGNRAQVKVLLEQLRHSADAPVADRSERLLERL